jgi:hypothetical protein
MSALTYGIAADLALLAPCDGMPVTDLSPAELAAFERLCAAGLARRDSAGVAATMGLETVCVTGRAA